MKRLFLFAIGALTSVQLSAQHEINLSINSGIGKTALNHSPINDFSDTRIGDFYAPTFGINAHYSYSFGDFAIESGLRFNDLKGNYTEGVNYTEIQLDGSVREIENDVVNMRSLRYLTVPVALNYTMDKLTIGAGGYFSYALRSEHYVINYVNQEINELQSVGNHTSKIDLGLTAHVSYALSDRASLLFSTNFGLKDISNGKELGAQYSLTQFNPIQRSVKNRQFMIGLKFRLFES